MKKQDTKPSAAARDKLLQAAIKIFGQYGFEGASTRQLAREAGVNISAIPYYFTSKEGLYEAVIEHISGNARAEMGPRAQAIREALANPDLKEEECRKLLHGFLEGLIRFLLSERASPQMGRIFIREQMDPTPAFDRLYESTMRPMHETLTALVARISGLPFPGEQATLCAQTLLGQAVIFKTHREGALRRLGWKKYGENEIAHVVATVQAHSNAILDHYRNEKGNT